MQALVLAASVIALGCGGRTGVERVPTDSVEGRVTVNNRTIPGLLVVFHPAADNSNIDAVRAYGRNDKDGRFRLSTFEKEDGAPAGNYVVTVNRQDDEAVDFEIPSAYAAPDSSPLRVEIKPQATQLKTFQLES